jgi:hypothetical protein
VVYRLELNSQLSAFNAKRGSAETRHAFDHLFLRWFLFDFCYYNIRSSRLKAFFDE